MDSRVQHAREAEKGFTLIELLVVIIIIGILAAIAIPVYLHQRTRGYDAAAKSDLRNLAAFEETYLVTYETYGTLAAVDAETPINPSHDVTLTAHFSGASGYCLSAKHSGSSVTWYYDSLGGGLQDRGKTCPNASTFDTDGGSISG